VEERSKTCTAIRRAGTRLAVSDDQEREMASGRRVWVSVVAMLFIESPLGAQVFAAVCAF